MTGITGTLTEAVELWYIILVQAIAQIITMVPVTMKGFGIIEATNIFLLERMGVEGEVVLAASISGRVIHLFFMILRKSRRLPAIRRRNSR